MNVYDFDKTIYRGDSTVDFVLWLYLHKPKTMISIPRTLWFGLLYVIHLTNKLTFKENLYHMFNYVDNMDDAVEKFVKSHMHKIKLYYLTQKKEDDVIISASPEFTIKQFGKALGLNYVMASVVDKKTGEYLGVNCHGVEKVRRYREVFSDTPIDEFYSDSLSDTPLAKIADKAYLVKGNDIKLWPNK